MAVSPAARVQTHLAPSFDGEDEIAADVAALCAGAVALSQIGNRDASVRLLMAAVALSPSNLRAHRRLAAAFANSGDPVAAADEYARYIAVALKKGDTARAELEVEYARATLPLALVALPSPTAAPTMVRPSPVRKRADRRRRAARRFSWSMPPLIRTVLAALVISGLGAAVSLGVSQVLGHR